MRFLLVLIMFAFAGCGSPSEENASTPNSSSDEMETAADGVQESAETSMDKAQNVEKVLQDAADARNAAIEESSGDN
jgi:hypothetical protein